jgi:hypothetical protein
LFNAANSTILDAATHDSNIMTFTQDNWYEKITFSIANDLDSDVTLTFYGARDIGMDPEHQLGDPIVVAAGATNVQTLTDFFTAIMIVAQCAIAPTTGALDVVALPVMHDSGQH